MRNRWGTTKSLEIPKKNNQNTSIPWTMLGIASTYEEIEYVKVALNIMSRESGGDKRCTLQCMLGSGGLYSAQGDYAKAESKNLLNHLKWLAILMLCHLFLRHIHPLQTITNQQESLGKGT